MADNKLVIPIIANLDSFRRSMDEVSRSLTQFEKPQASNLGSQVAAFKPPEMSSMAGPVLPNIGADLRKAFEPVAGILSKNEQLFAKMAGSIIANNKRIDADIKFENFQKATAKLREKVVAGFDDMSEAAQKRAKLIDGALNVAQNVSKFRNAVDGLISHERKAQAEIDRIKPKLLSLNTVGSAAVGGIAAATEKTTGSFRNLGLAVGLSLAPLAVMAKSVGFLRDGVAAASNWAESSSKLDAVFGGASGSVRAFTDGVARDFGGVRSETADLLSSFGGLYKGLSGMSGESLAKASKDITMLAMDFSSFANITAVEAGNAIRTGLSGETSDVLKRFGVILTDTNVKQFAYANGLAKIGDELSEKQKIAARTRIIFESLADAQGDLARTSSGAANSYRALRGRLTNLSESVGTALTPITTASLGVGNSVVSTLQRAFNSVDGVVSRVAESIASKLRYLAAVVANPAAAFQGLKLRASELFLNTSAWGRALFTNIGLWANYAGKVISSFLSTMQSNFKSTIDNIGKNIANLADALKNWTFRRGFDFKPADMRANMKEFDPSGIPLPQAMKPAYVDFADKITQAMKPITDAFTKSEAAAAAAKAPGKVSEAAAGVVRAPEVGEKLAKLIEDMTEDLKSPVEKLREKMELVGEAVAKGLIPKDQFKRAEAIARKDAGFEPPRLAKAVDANSTEAYSIYQAARTGRGNDYTARMQALQTRTAKAGENTVAQLKELTKQLGAKNAPDVGVMKFTGLNA